MSGRVGDWLRASEGQVFCIRRKGPTPIGNCASCGFGTRIDPNAIGFDDIVRCTARAEDVPEDAATHPPSPPGNTRIVMVDDDFDSVFALAARLREEGFTVEIAPDGTCAMKRLSEGGLPDLLLLMSKPVEREALAAQIASAAKR